MGHSCCTFLFGISTIMVMGDSALGAEKPPEAPASDVLQEFDIAAGGQHILVPVKVGGKAYAFLLDTAAEMTCFDTKFRSELRRLNKTTRLRTVNGLMRVEQFEVPEASVGNLRLETNGPVLCTEFAQWRNISGQEVYGCLGMDFLQKYVVRVNFDDGKLAFLKELDRSNPHLGKPIQISYKLVRTPHVIAGVSENHIEHFIVDTGASMSAALTPQLFEELSRNGRLKPLRARKIVTVSGISSHATGRLQMLGVHGQVVQNAVVKNGESNLLGLGFWSRFMVTFDFPAGLIYLQRGTRFDESDRYDLSGLHILRDQDVVRVHSVDDGSPGAKVGIQPDDIILKVEEQTAGEVSLFAIRQLLRRENTEVRIALRRGDTDFECVLQLRPLE